MSLLGQNKKNLQVFRGGLINNVHVDIRWVVAKMSMFVHVRGVGGWSKMGKILSMWLLTNPQNELEGVKTDHSES